MNRARALRLVLTIALAGAGVALPLAGTAAADPEQICVVYDSDRRGICVETNIPPNGLTRG